MLSFPSIRAVNGMARPTCFPGRRANRFGLFDEKLYVCLSIQEPRQLTWRQPGFLLPGAIVKAGVSSTHANSAELRSIGKQERQSHSDRSKKDRWKMDRPTQVPTIIRRPFISSYSLSAYISVGRQTQIRLRSPTVLLTRATDGQNFASRIAGSGKAAISRE